MFRRPALRFAAALVFSFMLLTLLVRPAHAEPIPTQVYTQNTCTYLHAGPSSGSAVLADVMGGTALQVTGQSSDGGWYKLLYLNAVSAWVSTSVVAPTPPKYPSVDGGCPFPGMREMILNPVDAAPGPFALQTTGTITHITTIHTAADPVSRGIGQVLAGDRMIITQWGGDANGDIWYGGYAGGLYGWVWAYAVKLDGPDPGTRTVNGKPIWAPIAGKGMWFVNYFTRHTDPQVIVAAAKAAGITHLYPEVAISRDGGFYGSTALDALLPAAHAAGITVVAWVYPYLDNVAADIAMTKLVVDYRTPGGDKVDGIAADIEERMDAPAVYAYGQILRSIVGPDYLLVVTPYNPRAKTTYPFPEVAASFNVIAPQDYWHSDRTRTYTPADAKALLMYTAATIRAELGNRDFPIEELGQMYDMVNTGTGTPTGYEPSADEITANMQAAKGYGCIGVSYFEWHTASPAELAAFGSFSW